MEEELSAFQPTIAITPAMVPAIGFANVLSRLLDFDLHREAITTNQAADGGLICLSTPAPLPPSPETPIPARAWSPKQRMIPWP